MKSRFLFGGLLAGAMLVAGVFASTAHADYPLRTAMWQRRSRLPQWLLDRASS